MKSSILVFLRTERNESKGTNLAVEAYQSNVNCRWPGRLQIHRNFVCGTNKLVKGMESCGLLIPATHDQVQFCVEPGGYT